MVSMTEGLCERIQSQTEERSPGRAPWAWMFSSAMASSIVRPSNLQGSSVRKGH
jgi:hypothetical protein